jgi:hypothetical protein
MATQSGLLIIERILRDRESIWEQIAEERDLGRLTRDMLISASVALACYGAVLGAFNIHNALLQSAVSAVKLPLLFLVTLAICLPTLYLFNLVFGARLQVRQALALVLVSITVIAMLALAFAPISLFFLITANQYSFYKLLNVGILALSALVGLRFLTQGMHALNKHNEARTAAARAAAEAEVAKAAAEKAAAEKAAAGADGAVQVSADAAAAPAEAANAPSVDGGKLPSTGTPEAPAAVPAGAGEPVPVPAPAPAATPEPARVPVPVGAPPPAGPGQAVVPARVGGNGAIVAYPAMHPAGPHPGAVPGPYPGQPRALPVPGQVGARVPAPQPERQASMTLLYVWILLFGFVGTQLAWTLRPFFGSPGAKFELFRSIDGNFYVDIVRTLGQLF